ncbi:MAG: hypothetical protein K6G48_05370 [Acholeplasmatales bacterium]|nr:hypothetical protein [Acholeplasmatales bacterium]
MNEELYEILDIIYDSELGFNKNELSSMLEINSFDLDLYLNYLLDKGVLKLEGELYIPQVEYDIALDLLSKGV